MKEISKYIEKNINELFVFENPKNIISDYLNQKLRGTKQSPILMENEEWVYFKIQPGEQRELIYNILAYSLLEILDGQFLYGFIETGLVQMVDEFLKICGADSFIHEALHEVSPVLSLRSITKNQRSEQKKATFMKLTPPFFGREAIYRNILISLKNEEMLIAFLHEFWEDAMARTEIIVLPAPIENLNAQLSSKLESNKVLEKIHFACLLYIASYASEYNILLCCKSIHKEHFLKNIRGHCEVMGVKFSLLPA